MIKLTNLYSSKETRDDNQIILRQGEPMLFGKNNEKGLILKNNQLKVVEIGRDGISLDNILIHDAKTPNMSMHIQLAQMSPPDYPIALGIIRMVAKPTFDDLIEEQITKAKINSEIKCVDDLLNSGTINDIL